MKTLADGTEVAGRTYYYLLDFNENDNWAYIRKFGKTKLNELNITEFKELFDYAHLIDTGWLTQL